MISTHPTMNRKALQPLIDWTQDSKRKPLVIRGARQVGKTWLVRHLAQKCFTHLLEINFDQSPQKADLISTDIEQTLLYLNLDTGIPIEDGKTLIFFDEIQSVPHLLHCLRYFYEARPQLHVIIAGSLLDFTLNDHAFSMPVGRLSYFHLGPMSFEEFLEAHQQHTLLQLIKTYTLNPPPDSLHQKLLSWIKRYYLVGGMPSVVACSVEHDSWQPLQLEQEDLISTYRDDFTKYQGRVDLSLLRHLFNRLPNQIGKKVKYSHFQADTPSKKVALHLQHLIHARLIHPIYHSSANGLPLGAEVDEKKFKLLFLDLGLLSRQCGLSLNGPMSLEAFTWVNQGQLAEQFIGQHLLYRKGPRFQPLLYYWLRENKSSNAELDYLIDFKGSPLAIEIKSGKTGSLKSLHVFTRSKQIPLAVRFYTGPIAWEEVKASVPLEGKADLTFKLLSLPLYLVEQLDRILELVDI